MEKLLKKLDELIETMEESREIAGEIVLWKEKLEEILLEKIREHKYFDFKEVDIAYGDLKITLSSSSVEIDANVNREEVEKYLTDNYWPYVHRVEEALKFKKFLEKIDDILKGFDKKIHEFRNKNKALKKVLEEVREILSPIVVAKKLAK